MTLLIQNEERRGAERPQHPRYQDMNTSYSKFLVTHPPLFSGAKDLLEADDWLRTIESKFSLLNCIEYQRHCVQLRSSEVQQGPGGHLTPPHFQQTIMCHGASSVPLSVATTYQRALCVELAEFLDLRQRNRSVYEYIQEFNNLVQ
jgi:hypothetical protein